MQENKTFSVQLHYSQDAVVYNQVEFLIDIPSSVFLQALLFTYLILLSIF